MKTIWNLLLNQVTEELVFILQEVAEGCREDKAPEDMMKSFNLQEASDFYFLFLICQTPADSEGQGSLACCSPWGCKESDTTS